MICRLQWKPSNVKTSTESWSQVGRQPAMEAIPLVMEPESTMYSDPVVVLDYQSLYPSQIIAYNLCFCTCLGRPAHASDPSQAHKLGASSLCLPAGTLTGSLAPDKCAPATVTADILPRHTCISATCLRSGGGSPPGDLSG